MKGHCSKDVLTKAILSQFQKIFEIISEKYPIFNVELYVDLIDKSQRSDGRSLIRSMSLTIYSNETLVVTLTKNFRIGHYKYFDYDYTIDNKTLDTPYIISSGYYVLTRCDVCNLIINGEPVINVLDTNNPAIVDESAELAVNTNRENSIRIFDIAHARLHTDLKRKLKKIQGFLRKVDDAFDRGPLNLYRHCCEAVVNYEQYLTRFTFVCIWRKFCKRKRHPLGKLPREIVRLICRFAL